MQRIVAAYDVADILVREIELSEDQVDLLRPLLDVGDDHELHDVYPLGEAAVALVERWSGIALDRSLGYYLESSA